MNSSFIIRLLAVIWVAYILQVVYLLAGNSSKKMVQKFIYPEARRDESIVEDHFGTKVCIRVLETMEINDMEICRSPTRIVGSKTRTQKKRKNMLMQ